MKSNTARRIAVITGSRADYGLLYWLMKDLDADPSFELQVVVTGMHLSAAFGNTVQQIETDGFKIAARADIALEGDDGLAVAEAVGRGVTACARAFTSLHPDLVVVLGDRYEILAAAQAALFLKIPLVHLHGGEITEGAFDESVRHALTKMSQLHFVSNEEHRARVIQLGERPEHVWNVGAVGLDHISRSQLLTHPQLELQLGKPLGRPLFLVTYHPVTLSEHSPDLAMKELFTALEGFPDATVIFTKSNADPGGRRIGELVEKFAARHPKKVSVFTSLGQQKYLSLVREADVVLGNSSSGLIEVPAFGKPTIDIGDRQKGRARGESVIHCEEKASSIQSAIQRALSPAFQITAKNAKTIYGGDGQASKKIIRVLRAIDTRNLVRKKFFDLPQTIEKAKE